MTYNGAALDLNNSNIIDTGDITIDSTFRLRAFTATEIGIFVGNETGTIGTEGTLVIPFEGGSDSNRAAADTDFGAFNGAIGCYNRSGASSLLLCVRRANGNWGCKLMDLELVA